MSDDTQDNINLTQNDMRPNQNASSEQDDQAQGQTLEQLTNSELTHLGTNTGNPSITQLNEVDNQPTNMMQEDTPLESVPKDLFVPKDLLNTLGRASSTYKQGIVTSTSQKKKTPYMSDLIQAIKAYEPDTIFGNSIKNEIMQILEEEEEYQALKELISLISERALLEVLSEDVVLEYNMWVEATRLYGLISDKVNSGEIQRNRGYAIQVATLIKNKELSEIINEFEKLGSEFVSDILKVDKSEIEHFLELSKEYLQHVKNKGIISITPSQDIAYLPSNVKIEKNKGTPFLEAKVYTEDGTGINKRLPISFDEHGKPYVSVKNALKIEGKIVYEH